ncbi:hypothetical protein H4Q26_013744 [Puccinia striiformis f. sp. tritici PST-130]|nr:hypothetical protein H4Q26_013744 [Puccinia striiformis f. sp. tritici PST-130]
MREPNTRKSRGTTNHLTIRLKNSEILAIPPPALSSEEDLAAIQIIATSSLQNVYLEIATSQVSVHIRQ